MGALQCWLGDVEAFFTKKETKGGSLQRDEQGTFEQDVLRAFETHKRGVCFTFPFVNRFCGLGIYYFLH